MRSPCSYRLSTQDLTARRQGDSTTHTLELYQPKLFGIRGSRGAAVAEQQSRRSSRKSSRSKDGGARPTRNVIGILRLGQHIVYQPSSRYAVGGGKACPVPICTPVFVARGVFRIHKWRCPHHSQVTLGSIPGRYSCPACYVFKNTDTLDGTLARLVELGLSVSKVKYREVLIRVSYLSRKLRHVSSALLLAYFHR